MFKCLQNANSLFKEIFHLLFQVLEYSSQHVLNLNILAKPIFQFKLANFCIQPDFHSKCKNQQPIPVKAFFINYEPTLNLISFKDRQSWKSCKLNNNKNQFKTQITIISIHPLRIKDHMKLF